MSRDTLKTVGELMAILQEHNPEDQVRILVEKGRLEGIRVENIGDDRHYVVLMKDSY